MHDIVTDGSCLTISQIKFTRSSSQLQDQLVNININNNPNINLNIKNSYVEVLNYKQASSTALLLFRTSNLIHIRCQAHAQLDN